MDLNSSSIEPFGYNGVYHDSFLDESSTIGANFALMPNNFGYSSSLVLNSNREDECDVWIDAMDQNSCHVNNNPYESFFHMNNLGCNNSTSGAIGDNRFGENGRFMFPYPISSHINYVEESLKQERLSQKRRYEGEEMKMTKKQCEMERKIRGKTNSPTKDPQGIAAKNRRERISDRLRVLQELVPNGTKVDLVTMLEKAISYVKFLQLQVKVLATDEFWPEQEGNALDISQVKEALDTILSSQKESTKP